MYCKLKNTKQLSNLCPSLFLPAGRKEGEGGERRLTLAQPISPPPPPPFGAGGGGGGGGDGRANGPPRVLEAGAGMQERGRRGRKEGSRVLFWKEGCRGENVPT